MADIINFQQTSKLIEEELTVEKDGTIRLLKAIPDDIFYEYKNRMLNYIGEVIQIQSILASRDHPKVCSHLLEGLDKDQFEKVNRIAFNLASEDPIEKVRELLKDTFGITIPTDETLLKAKQLVDLIKSLGINYMAEAGRLSTIVKDLNRIINLFILQSLGPEFEEEMFNQISSFSEEDIEALMAIRHLKDQSR